MNQVLTILKTGLPMQLTCFSPNKWLGMNDISNLHQQVKSIKHIKYMYLLKYIKLHSVPKLNLEGGQTILLPVRSTLI